MKKLFLSIAVLGLLASCTPEALSDNTEKATDETNTTTDIKKGEIKDGDI
jgi:hypothetical protein